MAQSPIHHLTGRGREETYEIQRSADGSVHLSSHGTFSFKILFTRVRAVFSQELFLDRNLVPERYTLQVKGPFNIGNRKIEGERTGDVMRITSGNGEDQVRIGTDAPLILGMFSTYAVIPLLAGPLRNGDSKEFQVVPLFGRAVGSDITLRVRRAGDASVRSEATEIILDRYALTSSVGNSTPLAKGKELIALVASGSDGTLVVYRSDYFPAGLEIP